MIKNFYFLVIFTLLGCNSQFKFAEDCDCNNGKFKEIATTSYQILYTDNEPIEKELYTFSRKYDFKNRTSLVQFYISDSIRDKSGTQNFYDKKGRKIMTTSYDKDGSEKGKIIYSYSNLGRRIQKTYPRDTTSYFETITYNSKSKFQTTIKRSSGGKFINHIAKKYDEAGNEIETFINDSLGNTLIRVEKSYDKKGNIVINKMSDYEYQTSDFSKSNYNSYNDEIDRTRYKIVGNDTVESAEITYFKYQYDERDNIKEKRVISNDSIFQIIKYKFDVKDNVLEKKVYRNDSLISLERSKYEY